MTAESEGVKATIKKLEKVNSVTRVDLHVDASAIGFSTPTEETTNAFGAISEEGMKQIQKLARQNGTSVEEAIEKLYANMLL